MGFIALGAMVIGILVAVMTFQIASAIWRMPVFMNLLGAFFMFNSVISLAGWLLHDLFTINSHISLPDTPWFAWLAYLGMALLWYLPMAFFLVKLRAGGAIQLNKASSSSEQ
jgi:hypothetical protein